jgi:hypothetical protein
MREMRGIARRARALLAALFLAGPWLLALAPAAPTESDSGAGRMTLSVSMDRIGFANDEVTAKVTWRLGETEAARLRNMIIEKYDRNVGLPLNVTPRGNNDSTLDIVELQNYKAAIDSYLENKGAGTCADCVGVGPIYFFGVKVRDANLQHAVSGGSPASAVEDDMKGLPGRTASSSEDVEILYKFDGLVTNTTDTIAPDTLVIAQAIYAPLLDGAAPAVFAGELEVHHSSIIIGYQSYDSMEARHGSFFMLRTPAGEWLKYDGTFPTPDAGRDRVGYDSFNGLENPQVLFILLIVAGHFTINLPHMIYSRMRAKVPVSRRSAAHRVSWVHWTAALLLLVQILLYFFPTVGPLFVSGGAYWAIALGFLFLSWHIYFKKELPRIEAMKEEPKPAPAAEPAKPAGAAPEATLSAAGTLARAASASSPAPGGAEAKPAPAAAPKPAAVAPPAAAPAPALIKGQCAHCAAKVAYEKGPEELVFCGHCGVPILKVAPGYGYLVVDDDSRVTYLLFSSLVRVGMKACFATATMPQKIMRDYKFEGPEAIWLTDSGTGTNAINPLRLEFEITRNITRFAKMSPGGVVLIEGVNYLVLMNGYEKVYKFLKKLIDLTSMSDIVLMVALSKRTVSEEQFDILRREFDKVVEVARMEKSKVEAPPAPGAKPPQASFVRAEPPKAAPAAPAAPPASAPPAAGPVAAPAPAPGPAPGAAAASAPAPAPAKPREPPKKRTATLGTAEGAEPCASCKETIPKDDWLITCQCGFKYHTACANKEATCVNCTLSLKPQA